MMTQRWFRVLVLLVATFLFVHEKPNVAWIQLELWVSIKVGIEMNTKRYKMQLFMINSKSNCEVNGLSFVH